VTCRSSQRCRTYTGLERTAKSVLIAVALIVSAALMAASRSSGGLSWVAFIGLIPVFMAIRYIRPGPAPLFGGLWGAGYYLYLSLPSCGGNLSIASLLLFIAVPAVYTGLGAWLTRKVGYLPAVLATGWIVVEWLLGTPGSHPGTLTGAESSNTLIGYIGQALGYLVVAVLIAYVNALLLSLVDQIRLTFADTVYRFAVLADTRREFSHEFSLYRSTLTAFNCSPRAPPCR